MWRAVAFLVVSIGLVTSALAADVTKVGDITIHDAWARASLGSAPNSAAYMTLESTAAEPDRLIGGATPVASKVEVHGHVMDGGVAKMRPVDGIEIMPGEPAVLEPGGLHLMLTGLKQKLDPGATIPLTLVFEHAGEVTLDVPVQGMAGGQGHGSMNHGGQSGH